MLLFLWTELLLHLFLWVELILSLFLWVRLHFNFHSFQLNFFYFKLLLLLFLWAELLLLLFLWVKCQSVWLFFLSIHHSFTNGQITNLLGLNILDNTSAITSQLPRKIQKYANFLICVPKEI